MGSIERSDPVQLFCGAIFAPDMPLGGVKTALEAAFGPADFESAIFDFVFTDYYEKEMGAGLRKIFWAFERLIDPGEIVEAKLRTHEVEKKYAAGVGGAAGRTVNLDPGYVALPKLVLASTKDYFHRVYLRDGIYAEVTLKYRKPSFEPLPWTYPDYRTPGYIEYFNRLRERYVEKLRARNLE